MYTVIGNLRSRALRVLWALEEIGQPYAHVPAAPRSEAARAHHPDGKVPALVVDGAVLTDSVAIVQYLADAHGALTYPSGTLERGRQDGFTQFAVEQVDGPLWLAARHSFVLDEAERLPGMKDAMRADFARAMASLALRLGAGPYLMGERFTVPDLVLGHCAGWAETARFALPEGPVGAYLARVRARPALARALASGAA
jgi:glutathione S-transferase